MFKIYKYNSVTEEVTDLRYEKDDYVLKSGEMIDDSKGELDANSLHGQKYLEELASRATKEITRQEARDQDPSGLTIEQRIKRLEDMQ